MKNFIKTWLKIVKNQFSIFHIFQKNWKVNLKLLKIELNCLKLLKIENWIENCQKINFLFFFSLSEKLKIELKIAQNQFSFSLNYWKLNENEMDVFRPSIKRSFNFQLNFLVENWILTLVLIQSNFQFKIKNWLWNLKSIFDFKIRFSMSN